ncbi:MAG: hypothetical protein JXR78_07555 [Victivallales bacterium]|nr:hypothetical protein [Victivallales bacterium]
MKNIWIFFILLSAAAYAGEVIHIELPTTTPENRILKFSIRPPINKAPRHIMVLFGGRNWNGDKTIKTYGFNALADKNGIILISPWFKNDNYWEPEKWSGKALLEAVDTLRRRYKISDQAQLFYYGYSAGGQCAALFYTWRPELVAAWGAHACGVWFDPDKTACTAPAVITCGRRDTGRCELSFNTVQRWRDRGAETVWRAYNSGHELNKEALKLAHAFFESQLNGDRSIKYIGDDQTGKFYPASRENQRKIPEDLRSAFRSLDTAQLWAGE